MCEDDKICNTCLKCKNMSEFGIYKNRKNEVVYRLKCKECSAKISKLYRENNKQYYNQKSRDHYRDNPEYYMNYRIEHREELSTSNKEYHIKNKKEKNIKSAIYSRKHKNRLEKIRKEKTYGLNENEEKMILIKQNNKCAISGLTLNEGYDIDHCHKTGKVRGLLNHNINIGLGLFKDNPELLQKAIDYLQNFDHQNKIKQICESNKHLYNIVDPNWCRKLYKKNWHLKDSYGISLYDWNDIKLLQNNLCILNDEICNNLVLDHCHNTGKIRGLIKKEYNMGLGVFKDNIEYLKNSIKYLKENING